MVQPWIPELLLHYLHILRRDYSVLQQQTAVLAEKQLKSKRSLSHQEQSLVSHKMDDVIKSSILTGEVRSQVEFEHSVVDDCLASVHS
ncbi:hypothetical protein AVEN_218080-1 [Araneus ventricosus]|uniref:Uncharacterized protein n=1 Tax=Araneus ventricosus TaxID=182803 RepID=A0A4Y2HPV8_ARAVE|nr:hypothetical protein AVEN_218080-1 [Araneus ventricosus]